VLVVPVTLRCNNACLFCSQAGERHADVPVVLQPAQIVALVGGEPTLHASLGELAGRARDGGARLVVVQTNGRRLAYRTYARQLADGGVGALEVSLQGSTAAMHDYHTRVPGSFSQSARGVVNAVAAGMHVVLTTVVTRSNLRHLSEVVTLAHALGARGVRLRRVRRVGRAIELSERLVPSPVLAAPHLQQARATGERLGVPVFLETAGEPFCDYTGGPPEAGAPEADRARGRLEVQAMRRARPAAGENRAQQRVSGEGLREILPGLFEPAEGER
jgi:MoaA/NifB/PqqE/SkfB family radical SAM enzyme